MWNKEGGWGDPDGREQESICLSILEMLWKTQFLCRVVSITLVIHSFWERWWAFINHRSTIKQMCEIDPKKKIFSSLNVHQLLLFHRFRLRGDVLINFWGVGLKKKKRKKRGWLIGDWGYELIQGWLRHSLAVALFSGTISNMGRRKWVKWPASSCDQPYFSTKTSNSDQGLSLVMCRNSPAGGDRGQSQQQDGLVQKRVSSLKIQVVWIFHSTNPPTKLQLLRHWSGADI